MRSFSLSFFLVRANRITVKGFGSRYLVAHYDAAGFESGVRSLIRFGEALLFIAISAAVRPTVHAMTRYQVSVGTVSVQDSRGKAGLELRK
jgi:hypothetical protein